MAKPKKRPSPARKAAPKATAPAHDADRHTDGCEIDFATAALTPDDALPPARGGVAALKRARGK